MDLHYSIFISNYLVRDLKPVKSTGAQEVLSVHHMRLIFFLLSKIKEDDVCFNTTTLSFSNYCEIMNLSRGGKQSEKVRAIIEELKTFEYEISSGKVIRWLDERSRISEGKMALKFDDSLEEYLLDLKRKAKFTCFKLGYTREFKSKYAFKLYLFLRGFAKQKHYCMPIKTATEKIADNRYHTYKSINDHILKAAVEEINEKSDILISYRAEDPYLGKVLHINFTINEKTSSTRRTLEAGWPDCDASHKPTYDPVKLEYAKSIDIEKYLNCFHENLIIWDNKKGRWTNPHHTSVAFFAHNNWMRFSCDESGSLVDYLIKFGGYSFNEALESIWEHKDKIEEMDDMFEVVKKRVKEYKPPVRCDWLMNDLIKHLERDRKIPEETSQMLIDQGLLYPMKSRDKTNKCVPVFTVPNEICITQPYHNKEKRKTSTKTYGYWHWQIGTNPTVIYVCESPIDAVSLYLYNKNYLHKEEDAIFAALGGVSDGALYRAIIELNPDADKIVIIATDFDDAGRNFARKHCEHEYLERPREFYGKENIKDWNDVICELSRIEESKMHMAKMAEYDYGYSASFGFEDDAIDDDDLPF